MGEVKDIYRLDVVVYLASSSVHYFTIRPGYVDSTHSLPGGELEKFLWQSDSMIWNPTGWI